MGQKGSKKKEGAWNDVLIPRETLSLVEESPPHLNWPIALEVNKDILDNDETLAASLLVSMDQGHLFDNWELPGINDDKKHEFFKQVHELSSTYLPGQGGLIAYINNARSLLENSKNGVNPLQGWVPEVPTGSSLDPLTPEYNRFEELGLKEVGSCGFVLVAGGLGERLGYSGIKISLPTETLTNTSYIELYCQQILAIQQRYGRAVDNGVALSEVDVKVDGDEEDEAEEEPRIAIPLAIMVSDDTEAMTKDFLFRNSYFGLQASQVTFMKQGKVAALLDNEAHLALEEGSPYVINAKPHGHGDVHALMHSTGTAEAWKENGVKWVYFFQDTNGLAMMSLAAMIGVSVDLDLEVNSRTVPRVAKQAVGGIVKLKKAASDGGDGAQEMTINIEYNQLDPLLRSTGFPDGDVNDPETGFSIYPGNVNQLLFKLDPYVDVLRQTKGVMGEFVNPKYTDGTKTRFKKPTRLECMMQDYPKALSASSRVGFTTSPSWFCYSPVKNNPKDAALAVANSGGSLPPSSAISGESDQYFIWAELMRLSGILVEPPPPEAATTALGITAQLTPRIVLHPTCCVFPCELKKVFPHPEDICISHISSLVLKGEVVVNSLVLDGSLRLYANVRSSLTCTFYLSNPVTNHGDSISIIDEEELLSQPEVTRMRGYKIHPHEEASVQTECGKEGNVLFTSDDWSRLSVGHAEEDSWEEVEATGLRFTFSRVSLT
mmetsp:Transcript_19014/g.35432  ORF Transcript_19014/g.35432 Transcript_19014/m.35432 type:complete len:718 (+) Transcript_19014:93-2246(+)